MSRFVSAASEAVRELGLGSMLPLAQDSTTLQVVLSWFYVGWSLSGEDVRNALTAGRKTSSNRGRRRASDEKVLLEAGADGARCKAAFHYE